MVAMATLHLLPDAPITSPSFDRLDRMNFVRSFAEAIRAAAGSDSVVLALTGPWGSGKSSLINLIINQLGEDAAREAGQQKDRGGGAGKRDESLLVVRFNPWWFSESGKLVAAFLQQLAAAVERDGVAADLGAASARLGHLARAVAMPGVLASGEQAASRDIERLRAGIDDVFRRSSRRVLVFMDDIDRLSPDEMMELLLIVRAVADFPNTTYVLAFDHEVVSEAISAKLGIDGRKYLEKIVQLQIDVPLPGRRTLQRMVIGQLESIDPGAQGLDREGRLFFRVLFERGVKHFLATPRACTRLLNVLRFVYPTVAGEVYFPDMLGIATLMAFSSQAIQAIRTAPDAFVGHCDPTGRNWTTIRAFHRQWLDTLPSRDRSAVEMTVRLLFPKVAWALHGPLLGEDHIAEWDRQRRVCSVKHFETYFRLGISATEAAEYEWQNMVELFDSATAFARSVQRFGALEEGEGAEWVDDLLRQVSNFVQEKATPQQATHLFRALLRRGDQMALVDAGEPDHLLKIDIVHTAVGVLLDCLLRLETPNDRLRLLRTAIAEDAGLLIAAELLDFLHFRLDLLIGHEERPDEGSHKAQLKEVLVLLDQRIQQAADDGRLQEHPQFMKIVQKWWQFGRRAQPRRWVHEVCCTDKSFVDALMQYGVRTAWESEDGIDADALMLPVPFLAELFGRQELVDRCRRLVRVRPAWLDDDAATMLDCLTKRLEK